MVDAKELFALTAYEFLRLKNSFRFGNVTGLRHRRDIVEAIDVLNQIIVAGQHAAAFFRRTLPRMFLHTGYDVTFDFHGLNQF